MKYLFLIFFSSITLFSCSSDTCTEMVTREVMTPVYMTKPEIRAAVKVGPIRDLVATGALYTYKDYLFISDPKIGIHIYDNSEPSNPIPVSFIEVQGNTKLSVQNDILYADNYIDLLVFDISDIKQPQLVNNMNDILMSHYAWNMTEGVVIEYIKEIKDLEYNCNTGGYNDHYIDFNGLPNVAFSLDAASFEANGNFPSATNIVGVGGSLAKFTIAHNRLYVVDDRHLQAFDLSNATAPEKTSNVFVGWDIETIFPHKSNLFIGSQSGMFIFDASNPNEPTLLSTFEHARNCDPVFATDDRAYVTLRDGNNCQGSINQLDVIDITTLTEPTLIRSYDMDNPHGLSIRDEKLYICEGDFGLKVFDRSDDQAIAQNLLGHLKDIHATDVISLASDHLMVIGQSGLYQLEVSDPMNIKELSLISVK